MLLSVHLCSNRPFFLRRLVTSLAERATDRTCFEVVVKIDDTDTAMQTEIEAIRRDLGVVVTAVVSPPPRDYYDLSRFLNDAFTASNPDAYFCWHLNDEVVVETAEWDKLLTRYVGFFPDNLFRLKIDRGKMFHNFFDIHEVNLYGDYPITTRAWLELTDGWVHGHGAETYQEGVSFLLTQRGIYRNVPLPDFQVGGDEPGNNISTEAAHLRWERMCFNWDANMAPALREVMTRSACRIALTMTAHKMELHDYRLNECKPGKCITLITGNGAVAHSRLWYDVDPLRIYWGNLSHIAHRNEQVWTSSFWGKPAWYLALVKLRRFQDNVARVLFFALYFPVAVLFGLPVRCWFSRGAEWVMMTRRGWGTICAIGVFLSRHAPRLRNILLTCYGKAVSRGYLP